MLPFLFLLATASAGELEVTVTIDEVSKTFNFEQMVSCATSDFKINEGDFWYLGAMGTRHSNNWHKKRDGATSFDADYPEAMTGMETHRGFCRYPLAIPP
ncbi:MAG: hypothetical protein HN348_22040 [Proteobacteria bacterium]|jgi:hypothetical protein|nr:hypothetical protein [Pseudomonadota bacterium]